MFALLNFKAVFGLAFARICVSLLQAVVAFHDMQMRTATEVKERQLESCIFVLAVFKIIACYTVRSSSSQRKWGAISFTEMARRLSIFPSLRIIMHRASETPLPRATALFRRFLQVLLLALDIRASGSITSKYCTTL